jgi:hypothetical protein
MGLGSVKWGPEVIMPVLGGTAGFIAARYLGNMLAMRDMGSSDPKVGKTIAAAVGIPAVFALSRSMPGGMVAKNSGAIVLGMGLASAEAWIRDTPLLGGSPAAAAVTEPAPTNGNGIEPGAPIPEADLPGEVEIVDDEGSAGIGAYFETGASGLADYYTEGMLGGLGADPADQSRVERSLNRMESPSPVSTIIPTGTAMRASRMPQVAAVHERFANRGDKGHAGGMFARHLFSGMMGS